MAFTRPRSLSQHARVRVVAPSSPFDRIRFDAGHALITARYEVALGDSLFAKAGFLAGNDEARRVDIEHALADDETLALIAPRGGYGATRLLPALTIERVRSAAKWLVGFSDITALHALWARAGLCSLHGPMVCSLADASQEIRKAWFALLEGGEPSPLEDLRVVRPGTAAGRLFGGNLTVLAALAGTPYWHSLEDVVLVLEDVAERPYRLDRMLTTMLQAGCFRGVRAIVLGQFTDCQPGPDGTTAIDVLSERLQDLNVPILADAPIGHVPENWPVLFGAEANVDSATGRVTFRAP